MKYTHRTLTELVHYRERSAGAVVHDLRHLRAIPGEAPAAALGGQRIPVSKTRQSNCPNKAKIKIDSPAGDSREHPVKQGYVRGISRDERADVRQENARGDGLEVHRLAVRERGQ